MAVRRTAIALCASLVCVCILGTGMASARALHQGDRGASVAKVQRKLHLRADGVFGAGTARAVKRFQRRHGLRVTGTITRATARALGLATSSSNDSGGKTYEESGSPPSSVRVPAVLRRIAQCESGGDPQAVSKSGRYRGKYQFDMKTWRSLGGKGDPIDASESTQDKLAIRLYHRRGTAPWGACA